MESSLLADREDETDGCSTESQIYAWILTQQIDQQFNKWVNNECENDVSLT